VVKLILSALLLISLANASELTEQIRNIIGAKTYKVQEKVIKIIFKNENAYYKNGRIDIAKLTEKLKSSGLLNVYLKSPMQLEVTFKSNANPLLFLKNLKDSLRDTGYGFFTTKRAKRVGDGLELVISLKSESVIDPEIFAKELEKRGMFINEIQRLSLTEWRYDIDSSEAKIIAKTVKSSQTVSLKKPLEDYWIEIWDNPSAISIKSNPHDVWHPYVVFYDSELHITGKFIQNSKMKEAKLQIPPSTQYIKISDFYSLSNIKRGLSIHLYP